MVVQSDCNVLKGMLNVVLFVKFPRQTPIFRLHHLSVPPAYLPYLLLSWFLPAETDPSILTSTPAHSQRTVYLNTATSCSLNSQSIDMESKASFSLNSNNSPHRDATGELPKR